MTLDIGFLGCGTIGSEIGGAIADGRIERSRIVGVYDLYPDVAREFAESVGADGEVVVDDALALTERADLVIEAAGQAAVAETAVDILEAGTDLMIMSVGALGDHDLRDEVLGAVEAGDARLFVPSGALAGLDAVKAAAVAGRPDEVSLTTRKPPGGLAGAPYIEENDVDLDAIAEETTVFEGSATEAAAAFPSNINVALALTLAAGYDPDETVVRIVADPDEENNVHRVRVRGPAGTIETEVHNVPSPTNPKTSYLAALSAIEKLRGMTGRVSVGT